MCINQKIAVAITLYTEFVRQIRARVAAKHRIGDVEMVHQTIVGAQRSAALPSDVMRINGAASSSRLMPAVTSAASSLAPMALSLFVRTRLTSSVYSRMNNAWLTLGCRRQAIQPCGRLFLKAS